MSERLQAPNQSSLGALRQAEDLPVDLRCRFARLKLRQPRLLIREQERVAAQDVFARSSVQRIVDNSSKHGDVAAEFLDWIRRGVHGGVVFRRSGSRRNAFGEIRG